MTTTPPNASTELAPSTPSKVPVQYGGQFATLDDAYRWAKAAAESDIVPEAFRGKPYDILIAVQMGHEIGLAPTTALQSIAVINGRPGVWGDGMLGLLIASPLCEWHREYFEVTTAAGIERRRSLTVEDLKADTTQAVCEFQRKGHAEPNVGTFSVADARKANLLTKKGPWQEYPARMLKMRARAFAARDTFPDVLKGLRPAEELQDIPVDEPEPERRVLRRSERERPTIAIDVTPNEDAPTTATPATPAASMPAADVVIVDKVRELQRTLAGSRVLLENGRTIELPEDADDALLALDAIIVEGQRLHLTCRPLDGERLLLVDFRPAED